MARTSEQTPSGTEPPRLGWLDCSSGVSGDMLLGALVDVGVPLPVITQAIDAVCPEPVRLVAEQVHRGGLRATRVQVLDTESGVHRTWAHLRELLTTASARTVPGIDRALATFRTLTEAEGRVHGLDPDQVHLHEVGALDAVADIVGACAGLAWLGLTSLTCSPVALGGGTVSAAHGRIAVPGPAVVELLAAAPSHGGPVHRELTTPTGAALLITHVDDFGPVPAMTGIRQGFGAGAADPPGISNALRLVVGEPWQPHPTLRTGPEGAATLIQLEAIVDDADPRLWPSVIDELLAAGAIDAWLTPVLMRKGRPGQQVQALAAPDQAQAVTAQLVRHAPTLGVRRFPVQRHAVPRHEIVVRVAGQPVRVKVARPVAGQPGAQSSGDPSQADPLTPQSANPELYPNPEWDDVLAAAARLSRPARWVAARAQAAAIAAVDGLAEPTEHTEPAEPAQRSDQARDPLT
ncbi:MAG: nickel pincer cofactor biosynthesis protein LarC [Actinomycetales bacterium]